MTDLHYGLSLCSTFCPPNECVTQHGRVESPAGFTYGELKRVQTSAVCVVATQCSCDVALGFSLNLMPNCNLFENTAGKV